MKKLTLLFIALAVAMSVNAQKIGVKAGGNMSGYLINFWSPEGSGMSMGLNAGIVGEYALSETFGLRVDLGFNQLGSDYDSRDEADADWPARAYYEYDYKESMNYLQLGIYPKMSFGPAYAFVGPYFAYAISGNQTSTITPVSGSVQEWTINIYDAPDATWDYTQPFSDDNNPGGYDDLYNKFDLGVNLGVGANFSGVFVEANIGMGFMNFINPDSQYYDAGDYTTKDDNTVLITGDAKQKNLFFGLSVGYMLGK